MSENAITPRFPLIDALRGFFILLMIIYHTAYDLNALDLATINLWNNPFWYMLPRFIVFGFLCLAGVGQSLCHMPVIKWNKAFSRFLLLIFWAVVLSVATFFLFPSQWIVFGILHCIAFSSLACLAFLRFPRTALTLGILLLLTDAIFDPTLLPLNRWLGTVPMDDITFYPWFGCALIGVWLAGMPLIRAKIPQSRFICLLNLAGRHSLIIYLVHQPLLYGSLWAVSKILNH